jgi:hypothetical protein
MVKYKSVVRSDSGTFQGHNLTAYISICRGSTFLCVLNPSRDCRLHVIRKFGATLSRPHRRCVSLGGHGVRLPLAKDGLAFNRWS